MPLYRIKAPKPQNPKTPLLVQLNEMEAINTSFIRSQDVNVKLFITEKVRRLVGRWARLALQPTKLLE
jgi:hypothetical protein